MAKKKKQARRKNGEGSIYQMKDGRFGAAISYGIESSSGKRHRKVITGATEEIVKEKMKQWLEQQREPQDEMIEEKVFSARSKVEIYVKEFLKYQRARMNQGEIGSGSYEGYAMSLKKFTEHFNNLEMEKIKVDHLNSFFGDFVNKIDVKKGDYAYAPSTVYRHYMSVAKLYDWACGKRYLRYNPLHEYDFIKPKSKKEAKEITGFSEQEVKELRSVLVKSNLLYPPFALMLHTGLRTQEALAIRWKSIDLEEGVLLVDKALKLKAEYDEDGNRITPKKSVLSATKTKRSTGHGRGIEFQ